jgi:hypothetical protein
MTAAMALVNATIKSARIAHRGAAAARSVPKAAAHSAPKTTKLQSTGSKTKTGSSKNRQRKKRVKRKPSDACGRLEDYFVRMGTNAILSILLNLSKHLLVLLLNILPMILLQLIVVL